MNYRLVPLLVVLVGCGRSIPPQAAAPPTPVSTPTAQAVTDARVAVIDVPPALIDVPVAAVDVSAVVIDVPAAVIDVPVEAPGARVAVIDFPVTKTDVPATKTDVPATKTDVPTAAAALGLGTTVTPEQMIALEKRFKELRTYCGQACGTTTQPDGTTYGYYENYYRVKLPGDAKPQHLRVGHIQHEDHPIISFSGRGFRYRLHDGVLVLQPDQKSSDVSAAEPE